jgi:hypothetical protein
VASQTYAGVSSHGRPETDVGQALIEELLRTAFSLLDVMGSLLEEMPEQNSQGEDNAAVLMEMVVGSCRPAVDAAGEAQCWATVALIGAVMDRVIDDLRAAVELARRKT